ncbi:leukotriene C4 synthase-like isoform 1-T1 [Anomaloglossus baeobatrachus]|uniref:leukotriene C4 synthase-like n=1 Tax=Anomaloglossus baeobatrachus TaxID=238106 RepID=UPI003F504360
MDPLRVCKSEASLCVESSKNSAPSGSYNMQDQVAQLAFVTIAAVLEQAYFSMQVIWARRKYKISPPNTTGHPTFDRIFRAQLNCTEYFPLFLSTLWVAGIFFHQGITAFWGLIYVYTRYRYFHGYEESALGRLTPMYISASVLWLLIGLSLLGLLDFLFYSHTGVGIKTSLTRWML